MNEIFWAPLPPEVPFFLLYVDVKVMRKQFVSNFSAQPVPIDNCWSGSEGVAIDE